MAGVALLVCGLRDAGLLRVVLPSLTRQTPRWFSKAFDPTWRGLLWGADLGQGWTTRIIASGYYALVIWGVLWADPVAAVLVFAVYGLGRALPVVVAGALAGNEAPARVIASPVFRQSSLLLTNAFALSMTGSYLIASLW